MELDHGWPPGEVEVMMMPPGVARRHARLDGVPQGLERRHGPVGVGVGDEQVEV